MAAPGSTRQQFNVVANTARHLIFWEEDELCYNYKTGQWSRISGYNGLSMYSVNSSTEDIGLVRFSAGSVDLQNQATSDPALVATIETGAYDLNQFGRSVVNGARPLVNGGTSTIRIGVQDNLDDAVTWSTVTSLNSRTNYGNARSEGRYVRVEVTVTGGFTTAQGVDIDFSPQGKV